MGQTNNAFENQAFNHLTADNAYYQSKLNRRSVSPSPARKFSQNRMPSPKPAHKKISVPANITYSSPQPLSLTNPSLVQTDTLIPNPHKNYRSRSPTPKIESKSHVSSPEKDDYDSQMDQNNDNASALDGGGNVSENASDNGSEVSDEGYRSLGIIQNTPSSSQASPPSASSKDSCDRGLGLQLNRLSLGSQASTEDADINGKSLCNTFYHKSTYLIYLKLSFG